MLDNVGNGMYLAESAGLVEHNLVTGTVPTDDNPFGRGEGVQIWGAGAQIELVGNAIVHNQSRCVWGFTGADLSLSRNLIADTQPRAHDGELGCGVVIEGGATATIDRVILSGNHLTALLINSSSATITTSRVEATHEGSFTGLLCPIFPCLWNKETFHQGIADGIIAVGAMVDLFDVRVAGCSRAGVLFHASDGVMSGVVSTGNGFGLVLQGSPRPEVADDCHFTPNDEQDVLADSELAIPNASSELPEEP